MANDVRDLRNQPKPAQGSQSTQSTSTFPQEKPRGSGVTPSNTRMDWLSQQEDYLLSRGWKNVGLNERGVGVWKDPNSSDGKPEHKEAVVLPVAGGGKEVVKQWYMPPAEWYFVTEEAVMLQRQRDEKGERLEELVARKRKELGELEELVRTRQVTTV